MQYAEVAEYPLRGAVHFHALVRLDGPRTSDGFAPAPTAIDADHPYRLLGKWVHMLGFRGHFASKSRRYSVTWARRVRRRAQALIAQSHASGRPLDLAALEADLLAEEDTETTLVVGQWTYAGSGWETDGDAELARAAAARAREHAQWRAAQPRKQTN